MSGGECEQRTDQGPGLTLLSPLPASQGSCQGHLQARKCWTHARDAMARGSRSAPGTESREGRAQRAAGPERGPRGELFFLHIEAGHACGIGGRRGPRGEMLRKILASVEPCLDWGLSSGLARFEKKTRVSGGREGRKEGKREGECRKGGPERERKGKKHRGRTEGERRRGEDLGSSCSITGELP